MIHPVNYLELVSVAPDDASDLGHVLHQTAHDLCHLLPLMKRRVLHLVKLSLDIVQLALLKHSFSNYWGKCFTFYNKK